MSTNTTNTTRGNSILNTIKVVFELLLVIGFIVFEEIIWKKLVYPIKEWFASLKVFIKLQAWIEKQDTISTLVYFMLPFIAAELLSIYSGTLIVTGHIMVGLALYIAKIPVAGVAFWIFSFSKDKLLSLDWFNTLYLLVIRGFDWIKSTAIYKRVKANIAKIKEYINNLKGEGDGIGSRFSKIYIDLKKLFEEKIDTKKSDNEDPKEDTSTKTKEDSSVDSKEDTTTESSEEDTKVKKDKKKK